MTTKAQKTQIYKKDSLFDIQLNMSSEKNNYIIQDENFNVLDVSRGFLNLTGHNSFSEVNDPKDFFVNLNDGTNEGLKHKSKPFFSCQFHQRSYKFYKFIITLTEIFEESIFCHHTN